MSQKNWETWAKSLYKWQLQQLAAAALEALGPVNLLIAQLIYISQPVLSFFLPPEDTRAFALTLENPADTALLINIIRNYKPHS